MVGVSYEHIKKTKKAAAVDNISYTKTFLIFFLEFQVARKYGNVFTVVSVALCTFVVEA